MSIFFNLLIILSIGTIILSYFPFIFQCNKYFMNILTSICTGLLLGTALIIILPEGIHMLLENKNNQIIRIGKEENEIDFHYYIGLSMTLGFCFIYILSSLFDKHHHHDNLNKNISRNNDLTTSVIGLLIHSFIDGIALGASAFSENKMTSEVVFLALLLHKAPASFGIGSMLKESQKSKMYCFKIILLFSLSSPVSALITYFFIGGGIISIQGNTLGFAMEFSAGTFLYVGTSHLLQEHNDGPYKMNDFYKRLYNCVGAIIPYLVATQHGH